MEEQQGVQGLGMIRFGVAYLLTFALIALAVQAIGTLFLAQGAGDLLLLCLVGTLLSGPLLLSPLSDWACWLVVQIAGILASARLAASPVALAPSLSPLPGGVLSLALPDWAPVHSFTIAVGPHHAVTLLLLLLGMLTWELTWGVLWLVLRAGYAWAAVIMAGANLLIAADVQSTAETRILPFFVVALLLILWHTWSGRLVQARSQVAALRPGLLTASSLLGGIGALAIVLPLAWTVAPVTAGAAISQWATQTWTRLWPEVRDPLQLFRQSGGPTLSPSGFGSTLSPDGPFRPYQGIVMRVRDQQMSVQPYWRGRVYDNYDAGGWHTSTGVSTLLPAWAPILADVPRHPDREVTVSVEVVQAADGLLFAPGRAITVDLASRVALPPSGSGRDPSTVYAAAPLPSGARYAITAELPFDAPRPDAPGLPPDQWYTTLPAGLDPAIIRLAGQLTADQTTMLGKALAIQRYLRGGQYSYDTEVGSAPDGQDPISYFLFDSHRGYCVHFASAMALLARAAGLPARVVGGYVTGHRVGDAWVVAGADAHTWPEIFFTGTGWVQFEPTPGFAAALGQATALPGTPLPSPTVPATSTAAPTTLPGASNPPPRVAPSPSPDPARHGGGSSLPIALLAGLLFLGAGGGALQVRAWRELRTVRGLYRRMCRVSRRLAVRPRPWQTPNEFAQGFAARSIAEHADVGRITALYERACYGGQPATEGELQDGRQALGRLRRRWLVRRLLPWRTR